MTVSNPIVIVGSARTPMGGFQGELTDASAHRARRRRGQGGGRARRGSSPTRSTRWCMGCVLPAGLGQAPARQAAARRRPAGRGRRDDGQQDVRLGHEGGDHGPRPDARRQRRHRRRRRHGEHDQRALPADQGARRLPHRPRQGDTTTCSSTASRTPMSRARLMGTFAEDTRRGLPVHPRGAGRLRHRAR